MSELSENARLFLAIMRDAASHQISFTKEVFDVLKRNIPLTPAEIEEIGEILKADIREKNASYPGYGTINARLSRMSPKNPYGE